MDRRTRSRGLLFATLAVLGLALRGGAQQQTRPVREPIQFTIVGLTDHYAVPVSAPILSWRDTAAGEAPLLGFVTYVDHAIVHLGVDGKPISCTKGVGAFTSATGDALYITFSGLIRPTDKADVLASEGAFTIRGGKGKLGGATGSGVIRMEMNIAQNTVKISLDGTVSRPK
jgi:hypothetical protein